ncbi:MAG TPA: ATP-binding protein [Gaiellales bacterium]|nr:ATP-binding protein [Gaiellales bacterium]
MLQSLRTRLAFLFIGMLVLATAIAGLVTIRLYQSYNRDQVERDLRTQVSGIAAYYARTHLQTYERGNQPPARLTATQLEQVSGAKLYYVGLPMFPGQAPPLRGAAVGIHWRSMTRTDRPSFQFTPPNDPRTFIGVAAPIYVSGGSIGAVILARPLNDVNNAWQNVLGQAAIGVGIGLLAAFVLATFVARRITSPLRRIGAAADKVARGDLNVNVVSNHGASDELGQLAQRFQGMVDRLREVDELERNFLMRVTHELRTPLTAISGHVQAIEEGVVGPDDVEESMVAINEEVRRLERLVNDLLDITRLEAHQFRLLAEEVGLEALLEQAAAAFREKARANEVAFEALTSGAPTVITDGDRVLQIVTNLLDNAFRWTPRNGTVRLAYATSNGIAAITVSDSGPGIAATDREAVFHPFYSRRGEGGTGLGLSIGRELASALGGRLSVESEVGQGSTFTLSLPRRHRRRER